MKIIRISHDWLWVLLVFFLGEFLENFVFIFSNGNLCIPLLYYFFLLYEEYMDFHNLKKLNMMEIVSFLPEKDF